MKTMPTRLHPLLVIAALAVIVFSIAGVAAIFGKIPGAESRAGDPLAQSTIPNPGYSNPAVPSYPNATYPNATYPNASRSIPAERPAPAAQSLAQAPTPAQAPASAPCTNCGVIESIRVAQVKGQTSGVGAVAGGVAGGLLGNQIGHGSGRTVATIAGAAGGAYAGNAIEGHVKKHTVYRVTLRMDDGRHRTLSLREAPAHAVGDHVRVANGRITERA
ncbi:MAG TPA: glycine zipper 2TM domain-containing protein [Burkholderiales bacterium]|nr:glycine zipper 2TM domain-containing protein [Burkholderiales bacterium]